METSENTKKVWQTPEIVDLDVENTEGGTPAAFAEQTFSSGTYTPGS